MLVGWRMKYTIRRTFFRKKIVCYYCEKCSAYLESPISESGTTQRCPQCQHQFITPGHERLPLATIKIPPPPPEPLPPPIPPPELPKIKSSKPPPQLVWYGKMFCNSCGYRWQARRSTPPARCPSCSKRNVTPVRERKRFADGCLFAILVVGFIFLCALASHHR